MTFAGELETHLTVHLDALCKVNALQEWGQQHGCKFTHVVLDRGTSASQPMLTRGVQGTLPDERGVAAQLGVLLGAAGFLVTRIKIEAAPWNCDVPQTAREAAVYGAEYYWEHHIKLLLEPGADTDTIARLVQPHQARLSRNAFKTRPDEQQERFVTQRCYGVGRDGAQEQLDTLLKTLAPLPFAVLEVEQEYVIYDSNLALDAGWLEEGAQ